MKLLMWLLKAAIFFTLFAFALNNQQEAEVNFFFGTYWRAPLVLVVLVAFAGGLLIGALGMLPAWWKRRSARSTRREIGVFASTPTANGLEIPVARHDGL